MTTSSCKPGRSAIRLSLPGLLLLILPSPAVAVPITQQTPRFPDIKMADYARGLEWPEAQAERLAPSRRMPLLPAGLRSISARGDGYVSDPLEVRTVIGRESDSGSERLVGSAIGAGAGALLGLLVSGSGIAADGEGWQIVAAGAVLGGIAGFVVSGPSPEKEAEHELRSISTSPDRSRVRWESRATARF